MAQRPFITAYRLALILTLLCVVNFVSFIGHTIYLGGEATKGKVENGHFYVKSHGKYTEVTEAQFDSNKLHASSVIATVVGGIFGSLLMWLGPASATRFDLPERATYWGAGAIACFLAMAFGRSLIPFWLTALLVVGFVVTLLGGFLEYFVREWNAETSYSDADKTQA
jgi:hypothetical protein